MRIKLKDIKDNPFRDFSIDPIDDDVVEQLTKSVEHYGFWGGIVCRETDNGYEIPFGHHRIRAGIRAGIKYVDVRVGNYSDDQMIKMYTAENLNRRSDLGATHTAGSVASALKLLYKWNLTDSSYGKLLRKKIRNANKDIGVDILDRYFNREYDQASETFKKKDRPLLPRGTIRDQLANLKASGDYARIVEEVAEEIEAEEKERQRLEEEEERARIKALEDAEEEERKQALCKIEAEKKKKASERGNKLKKVRTVAVKAKGNEKLAKVFDYQGVAKHLKKEHLISAFRKAVCKDTLRTLFPVDEQEELAKRIVDQYKEDKLTVDIIRNRLLDYKPKKAPVFSEQVDSVANSLRTFADTDRIGGKLAEVHKAVDLIELPEDVEKLGKLKRACGLLSNRMKAWGEKFTIEKDCG